MYKKDFIVCDVSRTPLCNLNDNTPNCVRSIKESLSVNEITSLTFELPVVPNGKWLNIVNENLIVNENIKLKNGKLADIAPTMLELLNIKVPEEMTGESLIEK